MTRQGYVDALTGEGRGIAFSAAELLVNCIAPTVLAHDDRQWRRMSRRYRLLAAGAPYASAQTPLRSRITPAANTNTFPGVFTGMVNQLAEYRRADPSVPHAPAPAAINLPA